MKGSDLLGVAFLIFDHKDGSIFGDLRTKEKENPLKVLDHHELNELTSLLSSKTFVPNDIITKKFSKSNKQAYGQVFECKKQPRSDLFVYVLISSPKVQNYELKTIMFAIANYASKTYPKGFTTREQGHHFLNLLDPVEIIEKRDKNKINLRGEIIPLKKMKDIAKKYGTYDDAKDILATVI